MALHLLDTMSTTSVGLKECLVASAAAVAIASVSWYWKNYKGCECLWCKRRSHSRPQRVIFIRHGQSEGNVNPERYRDTPDNAMPMTELGKYQARQAGKCMKDIIGEGKTVPSSSRRSVLMPLTVEIHCIAMFAHNRDIRRTHGSVERCA